MVTFSVILTIDYYQVVISEEFNGKTYDLERPLIHVSRSRNFSTSNV